MAPGSSADDLEGETTMGSLAEQVETRVRQTIHGRIRDLDVREDHGHILIRGQAQTQHAKQLVLYGALQLLSGDRLRAEITVGKTGRRGSILPEGFSGPWPSPPPEVGLGAPIFSACDVGEQLGTHLIGVVAGD
jgi:hypothetical protein